MIKSLNPNEAEITPIDPMIELEFAYISSPAHAIKYPPDAATSSAKIITFVLFFPLIVLYSYKLNGIEQRAAW